MRCDSKVVGSSPTRVGHYGLDSGRFRGRTIVSNNEKNYFVLTYVVGSSPDMLSLMVHYPALVLWKSKIPLSFDIEGKNAHFTIFKRLCGAMDSALDF